MASGSKPKSVTKAIHPKSIKQIGHEARKPLVSLINTADLLLSGLEGELPEQVRTDIEAIQKNAREALAAMDTLITHLE